MKTVSLPLFAAIAALATAPAALATTPPARPSHSIAITAGDLASPARIAALRAEIREAARNACRETLRADPLRAYLLHACVEAAAGDALARLDALATPVPPGETQAIRQHLAGCQQ